MCDAVSVVSEQLEGLVMVDSSFGLHIAMESVSIAGADKLVVSA